MSYTDRPAPIVKDAVKPANDPGHSAAFVFLHGLGDDGEGWTDMVNQFQKGGKLPYMQWILPTAPQNRDAMQTAWYMPTSLNPPPQGRPELADDEDEDGLLKSVAYVVSLLDDLISKGVPANRIVLGGFSQGCAMALLTELTSKYSGKLAGIVGLMGYLPIPDRLQQLRTEAELPHVVGNLAVFLARGSDDRMIPYSKWNQSLDKLSELGLSADTLKVHDYQGLGHSVSPELLKDLSLWLESVVPPLE